MDTTTNFKGIQRMATEASAHTSINKQREFCNNSQIQNVCRDGKQIENYEGTFAHMDCECAVVESLITGLLGF